MLNTLEYFWGEVTPQRAERLLLETELPGSYLLRQQSGDTFVSFLDRDGRVKHYFLNQRSDSALYQARPELKSSLVETFIFMRETSLEWLYPVIHDEDALDDDDEVPDEGFGGPSCRVCGLLNPNSHHMNYHRLIFCNSCVKMVERPGWTVHKCNQSLLHCQNCTYSTLVPANLRRHVAAKHRPPQPPNSSNNNNNNMDDVEEDAAAGEEDVGEEDVGEENVGEEGVGGEDVGEENVGEMDVGEENAGKREAVEENVASKSSFKVQLFGFGKAVMTVMLIIVTCSSGAGGLLSMCFDKLKELESHEEKLDWLEPAKRGRGRPRCPPGWRTCELCGYHAPSKQRLRVHIRKHDREMQRLNRKWVCKNAENKCKYTSKRKADLTKHEKTCRHELKAPKTLSPETLWDIISLFPLSNTMAYNFLKMLEKALEFRFLPSGLREDMKTRLNCCMQFLESEIVQFKVRMREVVTHLSTNNIQKVVIGHPSEY